MSPRVKALIMTLLAATPPIDTKPLRGWAETRRFTAGQPVNTKTTPNNKVLFLRSNPHNNEQLLYKLDITSAAVKQLLSPAEVLKGGQENLSVAEKTRLE